jgi:hypothetical protein
MIRDRKTAALPQPAVLEPEYRRRHRERARRYAAMNWKAPFLWSLEKNA